MRLITKNRWIRKVSAVAALVANEYYGKKHDCFSGAVEMSTTAGCPALLFSSESGSNHEIFRCFAPRPILPIIR
jgi:hypothetical protein